MYKLPSGFVFLADVDSSIIENVGYNTSHNFVGRVISGYNVNRIICSKEAAMQLQITHNYLKDLGYNLVVYDGYRPQRAVEDFKLWSQDDHLIAKSHYYPTIDKKDAFKLGYLAEKSGHSRGSTIDLTLIKINGQIKPIELSGRMLKNGEEIPFLDDNTIDMGSSFDLFHEVSHHDTHLINDDHINMRNILRHAMKKYGFKEYKGEWWHYTLENEPHPDSYFDFVVE